MKRGALVAITIGLLAAGWFGVRAWLNRDVVLPKSAQAEWSREVTDLAHRCAPPFRRPPAEAATDRSIDRDVTNLIAFARSHRHGEFPDPLGGGGTVGHPSGDLAEIALSDISCGRPDLDARLLGAARALHAWAPPVPAPLIATFAGAWNDLQARCIAVEHHRPSDPAHVAADVAAMIRANARSGAGRGRLFALENMESIPTSVGPTAPMTPELGTCGNRSAILRLSHAIGMPPDDLMFGGSPPA